MFTIILILAHFSLSTFANICFKLSAGSKSLKQFALWQVGGNLTGFAGVLIYTALLQFLPISIAFPVTQGLSVMGVQICGANLLFKERIGRWQWAGTMMIVAGIVLITVK